MDVLRARGGKLKRVWKWLPEPHKERPRVEYPQATFITFFPHQLSALQALHCLLAHSEEESWGMGRGWGRLHQVCGHFSSGHLWVAEKKSTVSLSKANMLLICLPRFAKLSDLFVTRLSKDPLTKGSQTTYISINNPIWTFYPHLERYQRNLFIFSAHTTSYENISHVFPYLLCKIVFPLGSSTLIYFKLEGMPG